MNALQPTTFRYPSDEIEECAVKAHAIRMQLNPNLTLAEDRLDKKKEQARRYAALCFELSDQLRHAESLARRGSVMYEEFLPAKAIAGRNNRVNVLTDQLRDAQEEYAAAVDEEAAAQGEVDRLQEAAGLF
jgi:hypothetical protein